MCWVYLGTRATTITGKQLVLRMETFFTWNRKLFTLLLALTGQFSLNTHFNKSSRLLLAVGIAWSFCRICNDLFDYGVTGYFNFKHTDIHPIDRLEYTWFSLYRLMNTVYCVAMSFHSRGFHSLFLTLEHLDHVSYVVKTSKQAKILLITMYLLFLLPCIVIMTCTAIFMHYDTFVNKYWIVFPSRHTTAFMAYLYVVVFIIVPYSSLFFHFLCIVLLLTIFDKFCVFNQELAQKLQPENVSLHQSSEDLQNIEKRFQDLTAALEQFNNKYSFLLGMNLFSWMVMICGVLYIIAIKDTHGYDLYVAIYVLHLGALLFCCALLNDEASNFEQNVLSSFHTLDSDCCCQEVSKQLSMTNCSHCCQVKAARPVLYRVKLSETSLSTVHQVSCEQRYLWLKPLICRILQSTHTSE